MGLVVVSREGHRALPHTADVILEAWGPDLASCCEQAVAALVELYVDPGAAEIVDRRAVHIATAEAASVLLDVLDELIFTLDTSLAVPVRAEVRSTGDGGLDLVLLLADPERVTATGAVPKAVSRSEVEVARRGGTVRCRFLVDV